MVFDVHKPPVFILCEKAYTAIKKEAITGCYGDTVFAGDTTGLHNATVAYNIKATVAK